MSAPEIGGGAPGVDAPGAGAGVPGASARVPHLDEAQIDALRQDLQGWTVEATEQLLGADASAALHREHRLPALRAARAVRAREGHSGGGTDAADQGAAGQNGAGQDGAGQQRVALLTRLFVLGDVLTAQEVAAALPTLGVDAAVASELLVPAADPAGGVDLADGGADTDKAPDTRGAASDAHATFRATVDLRPFEGTWLVSDLGQTATGRPLLADHVLGAGGASMSLARMTVRGQGERVLDVGTGGGVQALLAAPHASHVVATDISARALDLAALSLRLAGVDDRVELRAGSMLEPAAGETFDLVVSNPPFVITPDGLRESGLMEYRDGGERGDTLIADLVRQVPTLLAPGGVAQFLGNWEHTEGEDWRERVASWIPDGIDAWVVQREVLDPAHYVETWLRDGGLTPDGDDRPAFEQAYTTWLEDFERRRVTAIGLGSVTLRRPEQPLADGLPAWVRLEEITTVPLSPGAADTLGRHVRAVLDVVTDLRSRGVDPNAGSPGAEPLSEEAVAAMAALHLQVGPDVTEERHYRPGASDPNLVTLHQGGGHGRNRQVDTLTAALVGASDGDLSIGQIAGALAALLAADQGEDAESRITAQLATEAVGLLLTGFVTLTD